MPESLVSQRTNRPYFRYIAGDGLSENFMLRGPKADRKASEAPCRNVSPPSLGTGAILSAGWRDLGARLFSSTAAQNARPSVSVSPGSRARFQYSVNQCK